MEKLDEVRRLNAYTRALYDRIADEYFRLFNNELEDKPYDREMISRFCCYFGPGDTICNIGCGPTDDISNVLQANLLRMIGIDISNRCLEIARARHPEACFMQEDFLETSLPDNSVEGVIVYHSLMYTPRAFVGRFLAQAGRILKPGGHMLLVTKEGETEGMTDGVIGQSIPHFEAYFRQSEIERFVRSAGFKTEFIETRAPYEHEIQNKRIYCIATLSNKTA